MAASEALDLRMLVPPGRGRALVLLAILAAALTWGAFPPLQASGLIWIGPMLLMLALGQTRPACGFGLGWLYGTLFMGGIVSFVGAYGALPWLALAALMGLFYGLFGALAATLRGAQPWPRVGGLASAWLLCEWLRGHIGALAFTFGHLAYSQAENLPLLQSAALFGHYGVSFVIALFNAGLSCLLLAMLPLSWTRPLRSPSVAGLRLFHRDAGRAALACMLLTLGLWAWGRSEERAGPQKLQAEMAARPIRVAAVQAEGTLAPCRRSSEAIVPEYLRLSRAQNAALIIWPETAIGEALNRTPWRQQELAALARERQAYLLVGANEQQDGMIFNSAFLLTPHGHVAGVYRKMDLVMFGEYVPGRERFAFLKRYPIRPFDYTAGTERIIFRIGEATLAPLICFEGIFPGPTREICRRGAEIIAILTSDAWAKQRVAVRLHAAIAVFRAIEARRYLIRAASVGPTAIYDPYGHLLAEVGEYQNGVALAAIRGRRELSVYHFWGDIPLLLLAFFLLSYAIRESRKALYVLEEG